MAEKKTVLLVGLGLIGGSMAMALKDFEDFEVVGTARSEKTRNYAREHGVCDRVVESADEAISEADVVIFGMNPKGIADQIVRYKDAFKPGAVVTDVGGIKTSIMEAAKCLPDGVDFIGCHPMAGKEVSGIENADKELFKSAHFIITPGEKSRQEHIDLLWRMGQYMGFRDIVVTTPEEHDAIIAYTSQLMHVLAVATCDDEGLFRCKGFEGGSFRDCTRVAALDVPLWAELFSMNAPALCKCIQNLEDNLRAYREVLEAGDTEKLVEKLTYSSNRKRKMNLE